MQSREFPGGLVVVRIPGCHGPGSIPGWGTEMPQATWQKKKKRSNWGPELFWERAWAGFQE